MVMAWLAQSAALANQFVQMDYNVTMASRARGTVFIELFDDRPLTRDNFLAYVNSGKYDGSLMHRQAFNGSTPFVLQGGGYYQENQTEASPLNISFNPDARVDLDGNPATSNPTVNNEFSNAPLRSNVKGTLAMAKLAGNPNSATCEYFFNLSNNAGTSPNGLDYQNGGFTVFAQVVGDGMALIDAYNGLARLALDEDANDDGIRDSGPFSSVPVLTNGTTFIPLTLERAHVVDYLGNGLETTVPANGITFTEKDAFIDTGSTFVGTGSLGIGTGRTLGIREGYSLGRDLINHGTFAPGLQLGKVTVQNYLQFTDGTLDINLAGTIPDTEYDRVVATNGAFLGGKLRVSFLDSFAPEAGDSFKIVTSFTVTGSFATYELPQLAEGLVWNLSRSQTAFTLAVAAADFNRDGIVDAADYIVWRNTRNNSVTPYAGADGNGDGLVNDADYAIWRANLGNVRGTTTALGPGGITPAVVPEPTASMLLVVSSIVCFLRRKTDPRNQSGRGSAW